ILGADVGVTHDPMAWDRVGLHQLVQEPEQRRVLRLGERPALVDDLDPYRIVVAFGNPDPLARAGVPSDRGVLREFHYVPVEIDLIVWALGIDRFVDRTADDRTPGVVHDDQRRHGMRARAYVDARPYPVGLQVDGDRRRVERPHVTVIDRGLGVERVD